MTGDDAKTPKKPDLAVDPEVLARIKNEVLRNLGKMDRDAAARAARDIYNEAQKTNKPDGPGS